MNRRGVPGTRVPRPGDVVKIGVTAELGGYIADSADTVLSGHGVGRRIHESPEVPNYDSVRTTETLAEGLVLAIEPILSTLPARVVEEADGWTLRTHNRALAAHYEHTVVIGRGRPLVLTAA